MRNGATSTAHYRAVLADLRADREKLSSETEKAAEIARAKAQSLSDIDRVIATLE